MHESWRNPTKEELEAMLEMKPVSRETSIKHEELRVQALETMLGKEFMSKVNTCIIHDAVYTQLLKGENPYKIISVLINQIKEHNNTIANLKVSLANTGFTDKQY